MHIDHIENQKGFNVIGIGIRTTNKAAIEDGTIQKLWQQFFAQAVLSKISNKINNAIVAVYYDFENDKNGEYNILIGSRVTCVKDVPQGMVMHFVPIAKRASFVSQPGDINHIVFDLWKEIWNLEDQSKLNRTYVCDYELYDKRSQNSQNAQIEIHIGIK